MKGPRAARLLSDHTSIRQFGTTYSEVSVLEIFVGLLGCHSLNDGI